MMCRFHVQTAGSRLTAQSVDNNVVRTTIQALAAVLGGAQSLHTNARDEALALPTEEAARLALRTQQILAYEAGVTETPDPLAGSYFVETLTDELEAAAHEYLDEIDAHGRRARGHRGGLPAARRSRSRPTASSGRSRRASGSSSASIGSATTTGRRAADSSAIDPEGGARPGRGGPAGPGGARRGGVGGGAGPARATPPAATDNLLPAIIEAVKAYATVGEISDRLRVGVGRASRAHHRLSAAR